MICPVLEPFQGTWNGGGPGGEAGEDRDHAFRGAVGALGGGQSEPCRGGIGAGGQRADVAPLAPALRGGRGGRPGRSPGRPAVAQAGARGRARAHARAVSAALPGLHHQAFPREAREAPRLQARLHHHPALPPKDRDGAAGAPARRPSPQAAAPADARHAAAPGRLEARLARRPAGARPDHHHGRRHQRDLLGVPGRRGRHDEQLLRAGRGDRAARPVHGALHRPRQPLLPHPRGRRQGLQDPADPGRPGAQAARHRPHPGLLAGGQRPLRARLSHPPGSPAQGAGAGRDHHRRGRQPVPARGLSARAQRPLRRARRRAGRGLRRRCPRRSGATCSASRRSAGSATTTACAGTAAACRSRRPRCGPTWCGRPSGCTTIPTARLPSSRARSGWPAFRRRRRRATEDLAA